MRVVQVNTFEQYGGAARAAHRLHQGLRAAGVDSLMLVEQAQTKDPSVVEFKVRNDLVSRLRRKVREEGIRRALSRHADTRPRGLDVFSGDRSRYGREVVPQIPACDVVNLHWVASFVDYESFFGAVPSRLPVVWTLHDLNAFTGGCHYTMGCDGLDRGCGACPQLGSSDPRDVSHHVLARKKRIMGDVPREALHVVTPSRWLAGEARKSFLGQRFDVSVIPYGLDLSRYAPRDRRTARELIGVPADARVVLFVALDLESQRKGHRLLQEALGKLASRMPDIHLVSVGVGTMDVPGVPCLSVTGVSDDRFLSFVYSAADVFAIPSREDNLPNTVLESLACGVPVVGFDVGGIPDMVRPGETGVLVPPFDTEAMAEGLRELLADADRRREMGARCRQVAEAEYPLGLMARRFVELYERLIHLRAQGSRA
jgi:glycosyltransferase involved in cell wall biosynthesis